MFGGNRLKTHNTSLMIGAIAGFAACGLIFGVSGCGKGADVIAVINGEPITEKEYYSYLEFKPEVRVATANGVASLRTAEVLGFQAMQDLIAQKVTMQLAKDNKIYPTEDEINKELEFLKKLNPNFLTQRTAMGLTFDMIRQSITLDLIQEKMLTKDVTVTLAEAEKYVKDNPKEFIDPARVDLSYIKVSDERTKTQVDRELSSGTSFTQVAVNYSEAPDAKSTNGKLIDRLSGGAPKTSDLPAEVQKAIANFQGGETTDWIRFVDGWGKFYVHKKTAEKPITMDDTKKEALRRQLAKIKGAQGKDINRQVLTKLKDSKVDVNKTAFQEMWKAAYKRFMAENKLEGLTGSRDAQ
jgi:parvulin-like peptidyl-prolyl isomerase